MRTEFPFFDLLRVVCCVLVAAYETSWIFIRKCSTMCAFVCLIVCDLGTSTTSYSSPQFAAAPQKVT